MNLSKDIEWAETILPIAPLLLEFPDIADSLTVHLVWSNSIVAEEMQNKTDWNWVEGKWNEPIIPQKVLQSYSWSVETGIPYHVLQDVYFDYFDGNEWQKIHETN